MKRLVVLLACVGCASPPPPTPAPTAKPALPPLAVQRVFRRNTSEGFIAPESVFAVVLTRPVAPVERALVLVDERGVEVPGTTDWLDRQLAVFRPAEKLPLGRELHLRIATPLRASDGTTLTVSELDAGATPPATLRGRFLGNVEPAVEIELPPLVPAAELLPHVSVSCDGAPVPFSIAPGKAFAGPTLHVRPNAPLPPDKVVTFQAHDGAPFATSAGRVSVERLEGRVTVGFAVGVGDPYTFQCELTQGAWRCRGAETVLVFAAPIDDAELKKIHPPLDRASTGDTRGHRFVVPLTPTPRTITLDPDLADRFGQKPGKKIVLSLASKG